MHLHHLSMHLHHQMRSLRVRRWFTERCVQIIHGKSEIMRFLVCNSGTRFVVRSRDEDPWVPLSFGQLGDGTPYLYMGGRVTPRTA